jgi:uncharacterized protein (TIGR02266 family)
VTTKKKDGLQFVYTRKHPRAPLRFLVRVTTGGNRRSYQSKNLSAGGIFILSENPLDEETVVELELHIPHAIHPIKAMGEVVWKQRQDPSGFAVKFTEMTEESREFLRQILPPTDPAKPED